MSLLNLAIETSGRHSAVAILRDQEILAQTDFESYQRNHPPDSKVAPGAASLLMPMIASALQQAGLKPQQLDLISVAKGPGMFTGLRVGIVTAKTMAFALECPIAAVDTLEACAHQSATFHQLSASQTICAVINAQRGQLFAARYAVAPDQSLQCQSAAALTSPEQWLGQLTDDDLITGPGLKLVKNQLATLSQQRPTIRIEDEPRWACDVTSIATLGRLQIAQGRADNFWELKPVYFRPSAAEEVRLQSR